MKNQSSLSRLLDYGGERRYFIYASWILSAVSAWMGLMPFLYLWKIMREVLDLAPAFDKAENLAHNGWMAMLFAMLSMLVYIGGLMCSHIAAFRVAANLRSKIISHVATLPLGFAESFGSGRLRRIINDSTCATETYLAHQLPDRAGVIATPVGLLALLLVFDWRLGLLSLLPILFGVLIMMTMTGTKMHMKMKEYQNSLEEMSNEAVEYVRGVPVVKTFGQTVFSFKKFKDAIDGYGKWIISYTKDLRMPMVFYTAAINGVFVCLIVGGLILTKNGITSGFLLNLIFYMIVTPVISVTLTRIMYQSENAMIVEDALRRIDSVLELEPLAQTTDFKHPKDDSLKVEHVSFSYDGKKNAIEQVSLDIRPGQLVAFVGPSGGGKTTLGNLLARFFDPQSGRIMIGGVDVRDIEKEELMNTVSFVFQNSRLIKGTILENVKMGKPGATRDEVLSALEMAQCMDIIDKFPKGVDTVIGTKGVYLSGGEQQRIAIARVMLKNSPIVILDEATAFADPDNEARVQKAFSALSKGKTVIMIAHRLSTIVNADKIFVIKDGQIVESGTYRELEGGGLFHRMWKDYQTSIQWKIETEDL